MKLSFTKMHGLGNDFMVIDGINQKVKLSHQLIHSLSNRYTGVGFDQCLLVEKSHQPGIDFLYRIFNQDGQEVSQCGNGARCLARFLQYKKLTTKKKMTVATQTTVMTLEINQDSSVSVSLGTPKFSAPDIPPLATGLPAAHKIELESYGTVLFYTVNVGNPHAVLMVQDIHSAPVQALGKIISEHSLFPEKANVGFMQVLSPGKVALRVYERGCGETQACGSGAVAAAAIGRRFYQFDEQVEIQLPGGLLKVFWPNIEGEIFLTGPAEFVYDGQLI